VVISQLLQQDGRVDGAVNIESIKQRELRDTSGQRSKRKAPHFVGNVEGEGLCLSLLSMARADGFENSLASGKRGDWFKAKLPFVV